MLVRPSLTQNFIVDSFLAFLGFTEGRGRQYYHCSNRLWGEFHIRLLQTEGFNVIPNKAIHVGEPVVVLRNGEEDPLSFLFGKVAASRPRFGTPRTQTIVIALLKL